MNSLAICVLLVCLCITGITGYSVKGNTILDPNGKQVMLRGVDRCSFEWAVNGQQASANDYMLMAGWGSNVVRIATNQDFWLGLSDKSTAQTYQSNIDQQIAWAAAAGMGVIIDLHWNDARGQQNMADHNSILFWTSVAGRYKNNPYVIFELYNEPHDVSWSVWLNGDGTWAGMQQLYNAVRAAGANNMVIVGGLNWAYDLSGVGQGYAVQGSNIAYATHPYDYPGKQLSDWPASFGYLASTYPVVMTEFGQYCNSDTYVADLLVYAQSKGIHWTAWAWFVSGCDFPSIISDWNGTPTPGAGVLVKQYLSGNTPSTPITINVPSGAGSSSSPSGSSSSSPSSSSSATSAPVSGATSSLSVYASSLASGWQDWSWAAAYSFVDTTYLKSGSHSIKFTVSNYGGLYFHNTGSFQLGAYSSLQFYVNGGLSAISASQLSVIIYGTSGNAQIGNAVPFPVSVPASQWSLVSIPLSSFGVTGSTAISGFAITTSASSSVGTMWIDSIAFVPAASSASTVAPTAAPTAAPTRAATPAPTPAATRAPTQAATPAPTHAPATPAPTHAPATPAPTNAPTQAPATPAPTHAPATPAPTHAPATAAPTHAPATAAPTHAPATAAPTHAPATAAPTHAPATAAPTHAPATPAPSHGGACGASSVILSQIPASSWQSNGQTISQYTVQVATTCAGKTLVGLTLAATNWNPVFAWNVNAVASSSAVGHATVSLASYAMATPSNPFTFGYQNIGGEASFTITSATFQ